MEAYDIVIKMLDKNGIDYRSNEKLAADILSFGQNMEGKKLKESLLTTDRIKKPIECPVCEKNIQIHPYSLSKSMCNILIQACRLKINGKKYFHVDDDLEMPNSSGGVFAKLRHWGIVRPQLNSDNKTLVSGMWTVTDKAMYFVGNKSKLSKRVFLYNSRKISEDRELLSIIDILGLEDYKKLMNLK